MSSLNQSLIDTKTSLTNIKSSFIGLLKSSTYPDTYDKQTFQLQVESECFGIASATAKFESSAEILLSRLHEIKLYCKVDNMALKQERADKCVQETNELNESINTNMPVLSAEIESSLLELETHYYNSPYH